MVVGLRQRVAVAEPDEAVLVGPNERRVPAVRAMLVTEQMPDARELNAFYASSAALCSWLVRHRPDGMRRYLEGMPRRLGDEMDVRSGDGDAGGSTLGVTEESKDARVLAFEDAFGDLQTLERDWLGWERAMLDTAVSGHHDDD